MIIPASPASPDDLLSPTEVYDRIMTEIEPELTSDRLPLLEQSSADESEEDRKERYARYQSAFEAYDRAYASYVSGLHAKSDEYRRAFLHSAEEREVAEEAHTLAVMESSFTS